MAAGRVCMSRVRQSSGLQAAGTVTSLPPMSDVWLLEVSLSERRTWREAYGPPMAARTAAAAALIAGEKNRPVRRMIFIGFGVNGGAPTSRLSSAASALESVWRRVHC